MKKEMLGKTFGYWSFLLIIIISLITLFSFYELEPGFTNSNTISGLATFSLKPETAVGVQGVPLRLDILANGAVDLVGVQISITYNPAVLSFVSVVEGNFLNNNGSSTIFLNTLNASQSGLIKDIAIVRIGGGANGNGLIAAVHFNAIATGNSNLSFSNILLSDSLGNPITGSTLINGTVTIAPFVDYDDDGVPDAIDKCNNTGFNRTQVGRYGCPLPVFIGYTPEMTTNFSDVDLLNFSDFKIGIKDTGQINFGSHYFRLLYPNNNSVNLNNIIVFQPGKVIVNSNLFPALNKSATVIIYNITGISNPVIYRDGSVCTFCIINNVRSANVTFTVPHFTEYSVQEGYYCGDTFCSALESCSSCSADCGSCGGGGGGGGGSGGGGGGGGGDGAIFVCNQEWQCSSWSQCANNWQTRECNLIRVSQHTQNSPCPSISEPLASAQRCNILPAVQQSAQIKEQQKKAEKEIKKVIDRLEYAEAKRLNKVPRRWFAGGVTGLLLIIAIMIVLIKLKKSPIEGNAKHGIASYVKTMRKLGKSDTEIRQSLEKVGWEKYYIDSALKK